MHICVNLAMGDKIEEILAPKYGVIAQIKRVLEQSEVQVEMLENTLWLLSNVMCEDPSMCKKILTELTLLLHCLL